MTRWDLLSTDANLALMSQVLGISEITAQAMANRGIRTKKTALSYLAPRLNGLRDPFQMMDMEKLVRHLAASASRGDRIMIYGDYDVDGVMGTVILYKILSRYGADVDYYIPHRSEEGYGLNREAVLRMKEAGVNLVIAIDNGIAALEEIAYANELGLAVAVVDHHEPGFVADGQGGRSDVLPEALAVVDPKRSDCTYPFKLMCAAGLAYKLAAAFCQFTSMAFVDHDELLVLAAIATVCDIVDLQDENRIIVKCGLALLNSNKKLNHGLYSLIARRGYLDKALDAFTLGFVLGPCINATGRLESAALSVQLLLLPEAEEEARTALAQKLSSLNDERKSVTNQGVERALTIVEKQVPMDKVVVLADYETHESVAGIVAGRIKDMYHRPVIMLTRGDSAMKGSGRSVEGYNLFEALYRHRLLFLRFGGHAMAAGLTLPEENIPELRRLLNEECPLTEEDFHGRFAIDGLLAPEEITAALSEELALLSPFGKGNREPLFVSRGLTVESLRDIREKNTLIFTFFCGQGRRLKGIAFGLNNLLKETLEEQYPEAGQLIAAGRVREMGIKLDTVYGIETNVYNGVTSVQIRIKDFKLTTG